MHLLQRMYRNVSKHMNKCEGDCPPPPKSNVGAHASCAPMVPLPVHGYIACTYVQGIYCNVVIVFLVHAITCLLTYIG